MTTRLAWTFRSLTLLALLLASAAPLYAQGGVAEERGATESAFSEREGMNVAQQARLSFGSAERKLEQAEKIDQKIAEETDEKKRQKLEEKQQKTYESAVESFREGLAYEPDSVDGWDGLGRAYRHLGKTQESLLAHVEGLKRDSGHRGNLEGWTLALMDGRLFGNATAAYTQFSAESPERAGWVLGVMESWLADHRQDPGDVTAEDLDRLAGWIEAQKQ